MSDLIASSSREMMSIPEGHYPPQRTSTNMSTQSGTSVFSWWGPKEKGREKEKEQEKEKEERIVVYDPLEKKMWVETKENLKKTETYVRVPIKGTELKVSVFMELPPANGKPTTERSPNKNKAKVFIATVDLGRLGKGVKAQRKKKRMQYLYVLGQNPVGFGPVIEDDTEDE